MRYSVRTRFGTAPDDNAQDPRKFLGMNTATAPWIALLFFATYTLMAMTASTGVKNLWIVEGAVILVSVAAGVLVAWPGDPLPLPVAVAVTAAGPVATALVLWQLPVPPHNPMQPWPLSASTALYAFSCVRGRTAMAWAGMTITVAVCVLWAIDTGQSPITGIEMSVINYAPLAMATFFALTFRPVAHSVLELREQSRRRAAEGAAISAALEERDSQLERLDFLARPLLMRIADGAELDAAERDSCGLIEAALRDGLRAYGLSDVSVENAARAARLRGVRVVLLDDGGLDTAAPEVGRRLRDAVATTLDSARSGTVTARIQPPGRPTLASILTSDDTGHRRMDIDHDGREKAAAM